MLRHLVIIASLATVLCTSCAEPSSKANEKKQPSPDGKQHFEAIYGTPVLDGSAADDVWDQCEWLPIDQLWQGQAPGPEDFSGRYKIAWDENNLYILAEITDDSLVDIHPDGLQQFWDDDCLEIFIDEDASGGNHQYNFNAFAYHIALDGRVVDIGPDSTFRYFDDHCLTRRITRDHVSTWEIAVRIFDGNKFEVDRENVPKLLTAGKKIGFALAYCDNDRSAEREHFMGSIVMPGKDKNVGWIDASTFGVLELK